MLVRRFLHARGFRYLLHAKKLQGKPDLVLPKYRTVIFVHGCFWHGYPLQILQILCGTQNPNRLVAAKNKQQHRQRP
ncbi:MAG: vsr [Ferruginibacter sp.]|nr:vsr [Ferruginibacter sp.]